VIVHEEEDKNSDSTVEITVKTIEGKTLTRRLVLREFLTNEKIEVAVPSETERVAEPSQVVEQCPNLTTLDDQQLKIMLDDPEVRERIVKLIEESEQTEETEEETKKEKATPVETERAKESKKTTGKKAVSRKSKENIKRKAVQKKSKKQPAASVSQRQKKSKKQPAASVSQRKGPGAAAILGTGLSIGLGVAGSRHGHGGGHRHHGMGSRSGKGME
jgi:outer membrane biosynthesis protein TonB